MPVGCWRTAWAVVAEAVPPQVWRRASLSFWPWDPAPVLLLEVPEFEVEVPVLDEVEVAAPVGLFAVGTTAGTEVHALS